MKINMEKTFELKRTDQLTEEQIQIIRAAKNKKYEYDEDCPFYCYDKLSEMLEKTKKRNETK